MILAIAVIGITLFAAVIVTALTPKVYRAEARMTLAVDNKPHVWNAPNDDRRLDLPVLHRLESNETLGRVIDQLDLQARWGKRFADGGNLSVDLVRKYLGKSFDVVFEGNTDVFVIRAYSESRQEAADIANALAENLDLPASVGTATLLDPAEVPRLAVRPNLTLNLAVGLVLGMVAGGLLGGAVVWLANRPRVPSPAVRRAY